MRRALLLGGLDFVNVASTLYFFRLNRKRSPYRYLIPVLACGEPVAATFIFSFAEVFVLKPPAIRGPGEQPPSRRRAREPRCSFSIPRRLMAVLRPNPRA